MSNRNRDYIWLSINLAKDSLLDKTNIEALAFALYIKYNFVSSTLKSSNITDIMKQFRVASISNYCSYKSYPSSK